MSNKATLYSILLSAALGIHARLAEAADENISVLRHSTFVCAARKSSAETKTLRKIEKKLEHAESILIRLIEGEGPSVGKALQEIDKNLLQAESKLDELIAVKFLGSDPGDKQIVLEIHVVLDRLIEMVRTLKVHVPLTDPTDTALYNNIAQNVRDIGTKLQRIAPQ